MSKKKGQFYEVVDNFFDELRKEMVNTQELSKFLENGIDINIKVSGSNALHTVCGKRDAKNRLEVVKFLIGKKININDVDFAQFSPLHIACQNPKMETEVIQYIVQAGGDVNQKDDNGHHSLFFACDTLKEDVVLYLCQQKAIWDHCNNWQESCLHWACEKQKVDVVKVLLDLKAVFFVSTTKKDAIDCLNPENKKIVLAYLDSLLGRSPFLQSVIDHNKAGKVKDNKRIQLNRQHALFRVENQTTFMSGIELSEEIRDWKRNKSQSDDYVFNQIEQLKYTRERCFDVATTELDFRMEIQNHIDTKKRLENNQFELFKRLDQERNDFYSVLIPVNYIPLNQLKEIFYSKFNSVTTEGKTTKFVNIYCDSVHNANVNFSLCVKDIKRLSEDQLLRYFKVVSLISHNNLISNFGVIQIENKNSLVSEFYSKNLLNYILEDNSTLLNDIEIIKKIATGLLYLQSKNMHHGNLKINNVILTDDPDNLVKLSDYYYSKSYKDINFNSTYVSPEQLNSTLFLDNTKIDIFAFGLLSYCVLFKKTEEDLFHSVKKVSDMIKLLREKKEITNLDLYKYVHQHQIRPVLKEDFPADLGVELYHQYYKCITDKFNTLFRNNAPKELKDILANTVKEEMEDYEPKQLKKITDIISDKFKKLFLSKKSKLKSVTKMGKGYYGDQDLQEMKAVWDEQFERYFNSHVLTYVKSEYMKKMELPPSSIGMKDLREFKNIFKKVFRNREGEAQELMMFFEVLWKDVIYCKEIWRKIPIKLIELIKQCWSPNPKDRPNDFEHILNQLDTILNEEKNNIQKKHSSNNIGNTQENAILNQLVQQSVKEQEDVRKELQDIKAKEIKNYIKLDLKLEEIDSLQIEKKERKAVLKKINDEISKLERIKDLVQTEMNRIKLDLENAKKSKQALNQERNKLTTLRVQLNEREKEAYLKVKSSIEDQVMARISTQ